MPYTVSTPFYNLRAAAKEIGVSRQTLYDTYLPKYPAQDIGGHPVLTAAQVKAIKAEVRRRKNGRSKAKTAAATT